MLKRLIVETKHKKEIVDLTHRINVLLAKEEKESGVVTLFITHTTAALTTGEVGEGTDDDLLEIVEKMIPDINFRHAHDPSHAWTHMAASIIGPSIVLSFEEKKLILGTWQSVLLVELDGPRERTIYLTIT